MITSTPGRMPVIAFSDDADYDTLNSVLHLSDEGGYSHGMGWWVALKMKDGSERQVGLRFRTAPDDHIGGVTWDEEAQDWTGPEVYVPLDDVVQIIVL